MRRLWLPRKRWEADHARHAENARALEDWANAHTHRWPTLVWNSKETHSDGDVSRKLRPRIQPGTVATIIGFSFSVEAPPPSGTTTVKLRLNGSVIATATLGSGGGDYSAVTAVSQTYISRDALTVELTTIAGATLPMIAYVDFAMSTDTLGLVA